MFISTLTPGAPLSLYMIATVEMTSTRVAVKPPCSVPPRLVCSSSTRISHTTLPGLADRTSTWKKQNGFRANEFLLFYFIFDGAKVRTPGSDDYLLKRSVKYCMTLMFTLLRTLSKPGLLTIVRIICFIVFKDSETIFRERVGASNVKVVFTSYRKLRVRKNVRRLDQKCSGYS